MICPLIIHTSEHSKHHLRKPPGFHEQIFKIFAAHDQILKTSAAHKPILKTFAAHKQISVFAFLQRRTVPVRRILPSGPDLAPSVPPGCCSRMLQGFFVFFVIQAQTAVVPLAQDRSQKSVPAAGT